MPTKQLGVLGGLVLFAWLGSAAAQETELELDLSEPKAKVPEALKPSLVILGVSAVDDAVSVERAEALEAELHTLLSQSHEYRSVLSPSALSARLGERAGAARQCADYACFDDTARALEVHRAVRLTVERAPEGSLVTLYGYDPGFSAIVTVSRTSDEGAVRHAKSRAQKNQEFLEQLRPFLRASLSKLATPNGTLVVKCPDPTAAVTLDGAPAGLGSPELVVQRGLHTVRVSAAGMRPFEAQVEVVALQTSRLEVRLVARPMDPAALPPAPPLPLVQRPGLYVAGAGVVLVIVGVVLGQVASAIGAKVRAGGDPVGVSRADAKAATAEATLANLFVPLGIAAAGGGTAWLLLKNTAPSAPPSPQDPGASP